MRTKSGDLFLRKNYSKTFNRGVSMLKKPAFLTFRRPVGGARISNTFLIVSKQYARIKADEIESVRKVLRRLLNKRFDRIFVRIYPFIALTKKPTQARMGRGKGARSGESICYIKPGKVLFEIQTTRRKASSSLYRIYLSMHSRISLETNFICKKRLLFS